MPCPPKRVLGFIHQRSCMVLTSAHWKEWSSRKAMLGDERQPGIRGNDDVNVVLRVGKWDRAHSLTSSSSSLRLKVLRHIQQFLTSWIRIRNVACKLLKKKHPTTVGRKIADQHSNTRRGGQIYLFICSSSNRLAQCHSVINSQRDFHDTSRTFHSQREELIPE